MGFEHSLKLDIATGERVAKAIDEYGEHATAAGWGRYLPGNDYDATGLSGYIPWKFEDPEIVIFEDEKGVWVTYMFGPTGEHFQAYVPEEWPMLGECVLAWPDIAWMRFIPSEARKKLYEVLEAHDVLEVWADIIRASDTDKVMASLALNQGLEWQKGGYLRE